MKHLRYVVPTLLVAAVVWVVARSRNAESSLPPAPPPVAAKAKSNVPASFAAQPPVGTRARCPVTDEEFTVSAKTTFANWGGRWFGFCCSDCKPEFAKDPAKYAQLN